MRKTREDPEAIFITPRTAMARYSLTREALMKIARERGAVIQIGRTYRINTVKMEK